MVWILVPSMIFSLNDDILDRMQFYYSVPISTRKYRSGETAPDRNLFIIE